MENLLIVEDDTLQIQALKSIVLSHSNHYHIFTSSSFQEAIRSLENNMIDLFFLDIDLGTDNGVDIAKKIRSIKRYINTPIFYVTSIPDRINEALNETYCMGYIIKPYKTEDIVNALDKVEKIRLQNTEDTLKFKNTDGIHVKVKLNDVYFIESRGKTLEIHTALGTYETREYTLKTLNTILNRTFVQCHKGFIVNLNHTFEYRGSESIIKLDQYNLNVPVGRSYRTRILEKYKG